MFASNLKTAEELNIPVVLKDALVTVLGMLERNEMVHVNLFKLPANHPHMFNMQYWRLGYCHHAGSK